MDLLTAILACSLYRDDALVRAIAESNSHGNPYALVDATLAPDAAEQPPAPRSRIAAIAAMDTMVDQGGEPLVGWMQIPVTWATASRKQPRDLFDPCTNIMIGTAKLSEFAYECSRPFKPGKRKDRPAPKAVDGKAARPCVVRKYAQAIRMPEFELVVMLELEHQRPLGTAPSPLSESPILRHDPASTNATEGVFFEGLPSTDAPLVDPFADGAPGSWPSLGPRDSLVVTHSGAPADTGAHVQQPTRPKGHPAGKSPPERL